MDDESEIEDDLDDDQGEKMDDSESEDDEANK